MCIFCVHACACACILRNTAFQRHIPCRTHKKTTFVNCDCYTCHTPTCRAYGTLEHQHKDLMTRLLISAVLPRLHEFSSQELSNSCWAVARVAHYDCNFMDTLAEHILDCRVPQLLPQHISNISWVRHLDCMPGPRTSMRGGTGTSHL